MPEHILGISPAPELTTRLPYVQVARTHKSWVSQGQALVWLPRHRNFTHRRLAVLYDAPTVVAVSQKGAYYNDVEVRGYQPLPSMPVDIVDERQVILEDGTWRSRATAREQTTRSCS